MLSRVYGTSCDLSERDGRSNYASMQLAYSVELDIKHSDTLAHVAQNSPQWLHTDHITLTRTS